MKLNESPVWEMLSDYGKRVSFLMTGVLGQTWEARKKAYQFNATLGEARKDGKGIYSPTLQSSLGEFMPEEIYPYAPPGGIPELRQLWKEKQLRENPELSAENISLPFTVAGLTHGLSLFSDMFVNKGDAVIVHDKHWENYDLIFEIRSGGRLISYETFEGAHFNVAGLKQTILASCSSKAVVVLNFPNNPSGYMLTEAEGDAVAQALLECADTGMYLTVLCDDAYFGFFHGQDMMRHSLFGKLALLSPNILAVRLDGATKEYFAGGFRLGFLSFGGIDSGILAELEEKGIGAVRTGVSSCSHIAQSALLRCMKDERIKGELKQLNELMSERGLLARKLCEKGSKAGLWSAYPFNAGYFFCLRTAADAHELRSSLLENYGVGVIALGSHDIRVALFCLEYEQIERFFEILEEAIARLE